ncbi:MAG: hypothetical protein WBG32_16920 [Nodosilinea sp.]
MAPKKLTEADKTSILGLYRQPQETTSTLAERYGVSNSTISRLLKASLPEAEYSTLIQQKRGTTGKSPVVPPALPQDDAPVKVKPRRKKTADPEPEVSAPAADLAPVADADLAADPAPPAVEESSAPPAKPTRKRRSKADEAPAPESEPAPETVSEAPPEPTQLSIPSAAPTAPEKPAPPVLKSAQSAVAADEADEATEAPKATKSTKAPEATEASEATADLDDDWDNSTILGDDYGDDDDDSDDEETDDWEGSDRPTPNLGTLEISPLTADALPPLCYVVVERTSSELVVLPLRTFVDLGQIPEAEGDSRTLPVFENHNVARRFSRRNQRVVKVPDGTLLQTTSPYLQAKGITRLLIDGQVFSLGDSLEPLAPSVDE